MTNTTPLWSDAQIEAILLGEPAADLPALTDALTVLRRAGQATAPGPSAELVTAFEVTSRTALRRRRVVVGTVAFASVAALSITGVAAAAEPAGGLRTGMGHVIDRLTGRDRPARPDADPTPRSAQPIDDPTTTPTGRQSHLTRPTGDPASTATAAGDDHETDRPPSSDEPDTQGTASGDEPETQGAASVGDAEPVGSATPAPSEATVEAPEAAATTSGTRADLASSDEPDAAPDPPTVDADEPVVRGG